MSKRVFFSYSHDTDEHKIWVRDLATFFRTNSIDVILDQWDVEFGDDLAAFMENSITTSDRVVVICTDQYIQKANAGIGGVGYEKTICTAEMLRDVKNRRRYIPVVRNVSGEHKLPTFFGAALYADLSDGNDSEALRSDLVRALNEIPRTKPELGAHPFIPVEFHSHEATEQSEELQSLGRRPVEAFSDRFSQAFPRCRGVQWFDEPDTIADRLNILLQPPLTYEEGHIAWWWRGHSNLQIEQFGQIEGRHFLMDGKEINVSCIAAVNLRDVYHKKWVYVQTNPDQPTGLYPVREEDILQRVQNTGYDYEEYGLVDGTLPITRAEYDDGAAIIEGRPVDIRGRAVVRNRYITPYNFLIAPAASPINNPKFDATLESFLNRMLDGEELFDQLSNSIAQLPSSRQLYL